MVTIETTFDYRLTSKFITLWQTEKSTQNFSRLISCAHIFPKSGPDDLLYLESIHDRSSQIYIYQILVENQRDRCLQWLQWNTHWIKHNVLIERDPHAFSNSNLKMCYICISFGEIKVILTPITKNIGDERTFWKYLYLIMPALNSQKLKMPWWLLNLVGHSRQFSLITDNVHKGTY